MYKTLGSVTYCLEVPEKFRACPPSKNFHFPSGTNYRFSIILEYITNNTGSANSKSHNQEINQKLFPWKKYFLIKFNNNKE